MTDRTIFLLVLSFLYIVPNSLTIGTNEIRKLCPINARVNLTGEIANELGFVNKNGQVFPPESRWFQDGIMFGCLNSEKPRLPLCCSRPGAVIRDVGCRENLDKPIFGTFPPVYSYNSTTDEIQVNNQNFNIVISDPCDPRRGGYLLEKDEFYLLKNGSIYLRNLTMVFNSDSYCLHPHRNSTIYTPRLCAVETTLSEKALHYGMLISVPFFVATFIVYLILPEMRNIHGLTLSSYVGCLIIGYTTLSLNNIVGSTSDKLCLFSSYTLNFSFLASFFWLNVMCFDIWWAFGGFRSLRGSTKQGERKKFLMYSIYAWGCASFLTGICIIMDFAPGIPDHIIRPEFGVKRCWFRSPKAKALYFYGPMGVTVICNFILYVSTATKIIRHKKDTAHHLKGMDSKRHDDNKQWFTLYLKLFVVMGINWSIEVLSAFFQGPKYLWYLSDIANVLQGVIIFIIFVCKKKIKILLIRRFGSEGTSCLSRGLPRTIFYSTASRTGTTSAALREKSNQFPDPVNSRIKPISDDSDGV